MQLNLQMIKRDSGEQHAPIAADDQEGGSGEQHLVQPEANKEQLIDKEPLSEADYMRTLITLLSISLMNVRDLVLYFVSTFLK